MNRNMFVASALGAVVALGLASFGCSSTSNNNGGTGGAVGVGVGGGTGTGTGGKLGGTGGAISGTGGKPADAGSDGPAMCSPAPDDGTACAGNPACTKNCGVNISSLTTSRAQKTCTCSGPTGTWSCPSTNGACMYPTDIDSTCLRLPATGAPPACPRVNPDGGGTDGGTALIRSGTTNCEVPNSEVCGNLCGSATAGTFSYQDSSGANKVGYCVCIAGIYQCASVAEWFYP